MNPLKMSESIRNCNNAWLHLFNNIHLSGLASQYSTLNYIHLDPFYIVLYKRQITSCWKPAANVYNRKPDSCKYSHFLSSFIFKVNSATAINFSYNYKSEKNRLRLYDLPCVLSIPEHQEGSHCLTHCFTVWTLSAIEYKSWLLNCEIHGIL